MAAGLLRRGALTIAAALAGCGSPIPPPPALEVPSAPAWRETVPWAVAQPADDRARGAWWTIYGDPALDALEDRLDAHSPDLAAALAHYEQARAATSFARAGRAPSVTATANVQRDRQSEQRPLRVLGPLSPNEYDQDTLGLDLEYEIDLWGRVRSVIESAQASESAARADLASARLSLQALLADDWIALRGIDRDEALLRETESNYARALDLVDRRHEGGAASGLDVARAQAQLEDARAQLRQSEAQRALMEHAIAVLVGDSPSTFSIAPRTEEMALPRIPVGVPSALLQRRPDIASAERRVAALNANIGVARVAYYPSLTLSALFGFQSSDIGHWLVAPDTYWAVGPTLAGTLFDGGRRRATLANAQAQVDEAAAHYRGVVLAAFQQVEDSLALIRQDDAAARSEAAAVAAARRSLDLATARYQQGAVSYLEVVASQAAALQAQRSLLDLATRERRASVMLVRAMGGGWGKDDTASGMQPEMPR